jgi:hypothetical protein
MIGVLPLPHRADDGRGQAGEAGDVQGGRLAVRLCCPRHVARRGPALVQSGAPQRVKHGDTRERIEDLGNIAGRKDVRRAGLQKLIDKRAALDRKPGRVR